MPGIRIGLSVEAQGLECVVRVPDTGIGISSALLPDIFELFAQEERSMDRAHGGLGVGLTLVKQMAELHGGLVEVQSSHGAGSEFVVRFPAALSAASRTLATTSEVAPPTVRVLKVPGANGRHAIHDRHHRIGQHRGDILRTCRALRHRVGSVRRQQRAVAESLQRQPPHPYP